MDGEAEAIRTNIEPGSGVEESAQRRGYADEIDARVCLRFAPDDSTWPRNTPLPTGTGPSRNRPGNTWPGLRMETEIRKEEGVGGSTGSFGDQKTEDGSAAAPAAPCLTLTFRW